MAARLLMRSVDITLPPIMKSHLISLPNFLYFNLQFTWADKNKFLSKNHLRRPNHSSRFIFISSQSMIRFGIHNLQQNQGKFTK